MVNIGSLSTGGRVLAVKADLAKISLTNPVCTEVGEKIALSRRVEKHWRFDSLLSHLFVFLKTLSNQFKFKCSTNITRYQGNVRNNCPNLGQICFVSWNSLTWSSCHARWFYSAGMLFVPAMWIQLALFLFFNWRFSLISMRFPRLIHLNLSRF